MDYNQQKLTLLALGSLIIILILGITEVVRGYSTYGAPAEFGNESTTTCFIGGDPGLVNCTGIFYGDASGLTGLSALVGNCSGDGVCSAILYYSGLSALDFYNGSFVNDSITKHNASMKIYVDAQDALQNSSLKDFINTSIITNVSSANASMKVYVDAQDISTNDSMKIYVDNRDTIYNDSMVTHDFSTNTSMKIYVDTQDATQDACSEITNCVPNAWVADGDLSADEISESKINFVTSCSAGDFYRLSGNDLECTTPTDTNTQIGNCSVQDSCSLVAYQSDIISNCSVDQSCSNVIYTTDKLGNTTTEIRAQFSGSANISINSGVISVNGSDFSKGAHTVDTTVANCSVVGSCSSVAYLNFNNQDNFNVTQNNISALNYLNGSGALDWIRPENIFDVDLENICRPGEVCPFVLITGDNMTGDLNVDGRVNATFGNFSNIYNKIEVDTLDKSTNTSMKSYVDTQDATQDACSEITNCVPNAWVADGDLSADEISESKINFVTSCSAGDFYRLSGNDLECTTPTDTNTQIGNCSVQDSCSKVLYNQSKTKYYSISPQDFVTESGTDADDLFFAGDKVWTQRVGGALLFAGVHLPHTAVITEVRLMGTVDGGNTWTFTRADFKDGTTGMASGNLGSSDTTISIPKVNNTNYSYFFEVNMGTANHNIYGGFVKYTIEDPWS